MNKFKILLVDDDPLVAATLQMILPETWALHAADSPQQIALHLDFQLAMVDMHLTPAQGAEGLSLIAELKNNSPGLEIIAMSGEINLDLMEKGLQAGASRFLAKPLVETEVIGQLNKAEALCRLRQAPFQRSMKTAWIGQSSFSQSLRRQLAQYRGEPGPILIEGASGTGKEVVAKLLHEQEGRGPWVPVNIASIPETLFESELFGHLKGAFTGAHRDHVGLIEAAQGGDLFLDEIEALPLNLQVKLLRFLESGEIRRLGDTIDRRPLTRVVLATNENLEELVAQGRFREDLLWRISGKKIILTPLHQRREDIEELAKYFLKQGASRGILKRLTPEAIQVLEAYTWPGNVRELKRICENLLLHSPLPLIRAMDVETALGPGSLALSGGDLSLSELLGRYEAQIIEQTLHRLSDIDKTAETLKISRSGLYKKMKDYGIEWKGRS